MAVRPHSETLGPVIPRSGAGAWCVVCGVWVCWGGDPAPGAVFTTLQHSSSLHYIQSTSPYPPPPTPPPAYTCTVYTPSYYRPHFNTHDSPIHGLVLMFTINYVCMLANQTRCRWCPSMCTANCNIFCII